MGMAVASSRRSSLHSLATIRLPNLTRSTAPSQTFKTPSLESATAVEPSDEALISLVCEENAEALGLLFRRFAYAVRGVAYRILRDSSEADDLLQDLFVSIQRKCRMFDPSRGSARHWILQMAYHSALARLRYLKSRHFYTHVDLEEVENELSDCGNGNGGQEYGEEGLAENPGLKRAFDGLSDDQRETLRLFFVEGYTLPEIAAKLNQSHGNVKHHYFRGLERLRKHVFNGKLRGNSAV